MTDILKTPTIALIDALNADATLTAAVGAGVWLGVAPGIDETGTAPVMVVRLVGAPLWASAFDKKGPRAYRYQLYIEAGPDHLAAYQAALVRIGQMWHAPDTLPTLTDWAVTSSTVEDLTEDALVEGQTRVVRLSCVLVIVAEPTA